MRSFWSRLAIAIAIASPAAAFHTVFDFTVNRFSVDGNTHGAKDGVPDSTDDFDAPSNLNWRTPYSSSHVADGHFYHFTLYTFGGGQYFNELFSVDIQTVGDTTTTTTQPGLDQAVRGRLYLRPSGLRMDAMDTAIDAGAGHRSNDDPIERGGGVRIVSPTAGLDVTFPMQRSGWVRRGLPEENHGYTYTSPPSSPRPVKYASIRRGAARSNGSRKPGRIIVKTHGDPSAFLGVNPMPVTVVVSIGEHAQCVTFTSARSFSPGKHLNASVASVPGECPP